jgi:hypothetical protein
MPTQALFIPTFSLCAPQQFRESPPVSDSISGIEPVLQCVRVSNRRAAARRAAMHPASGLMPHRWRLARVPGSRPRSTAPAQVHGQSLVHEVDPPNLIKPPAPPGHRADNRFSAGVNVDVLDRDFLLTLAPISPQGFHMAGVSAGKFRGAVQYLRWAFKGSLRNYDPCLFQETSLGKLQERPLRGAFRYPSDVAASSRDRPGDRYSRRMPMRGHCVGIDEDARAQEIAPVTASSRLSLVLFPHHFDVEGVVGA